jgi:enoyl-CoA hydratase/carnithine racemase
MHCDHLIAAQPNPDKPYHIGLPEAGLSICPGWGGTNLLPARMEDAARAITMTATGKTVPAHTAHELGIVSRLIADTDLLDVARDLARTAPPRPSDLPIWIGDDQHRNRVAKALETIELPESGPAGATHTAIQIGLEKSWPAALASERSSLIALRSAPEGAAAINAFFEKSAKPKTTKA